MDTKGKCVIGVILWGVALILLLAAAFDILPMEDNKIIFLALACFIVGIVIKKISKGGDSCCK